jgi:tetratricopeptide (TPR) repeat protein
VLDRAVAAPNPAVAIGVGFSMWRFWQKHGHLAEARRRLEAMAATPWSRDDARLRAKLMEALGGTYWWQGEISLMAPCYTEALDIWLAIGDKTEIANAYYNASFQYAVPDRRSGRATVDKEGLGLASLEKARDIYHELGDRRGEANAVWGLGNYRYFQEYDDFGIAAATEALEMFRAIGDRTMEAWSLHMLGTAQLRMADYEAARVNVTHAMRHFYAAGDAAGITLTLDDLSSLAVASGDLPRAARLRGAARNLTALTGTGLAGYVDEMYEGGAVRPAVVRQMDKEDLARYGAEGAALTLDQAVVYALEVADPEAEGTDERA